MLSSLIYFIFLQKLYPSLNICQTIKSVLDTANRLSKINNATLSNTDGAKRIDDITNAIKGLSKENALLALSTANVNTEDIKTIMIKSGIITAKEAETLATTTSTAATTANTTAKMANFSVTNLLKVAWAKLTAVMYANPLLAIAGAITAVTVGIINLVSWFEKAGERAKDNVQKAKEAFEQTQSEIDQLNSSLKTTQSRIDELNAKENLSLIESEELMKLKESNDELERELRIKQALAKIQGKEANDKAVKYFNTKTNKVEYSVGNNGMYVSDPVNYSLIDSVEKKLSKIPELEQNRTELQKQLQKIENTDSSYRNNPDWINLQGNINRLQTELENYQTFVDEAILDFMEIDDSLMEGYDEGILEKLETIYTMYDEIVNGTAQSHTNTISAVFDKADFKGIKERLVELGTDGKLSIDILNSGFSQLVQYLDAAGISAEELLQYIMNLANPDALKYDELKHQLKNDISQSLNNVKDITPFNFGVKSILEIEHFNNLGLFEEEALKAYASIKAKYVNGETELWTPEDWIANIQENLNTSGTMGIGVSLSVSDTLGQLAARLKPSFDSLKAVYQDIFISDKNGQTLLALENADISMFDSIKSKLDELNGMDGITVDYTAFEHLFTVLHDTLSSETDVENAFRALAASITQAALSGTEDFMTLNATLEDLGVTNHELVAFDALISNTETLKNAGLDLSSISEMEKEQADKAIKKFAEESVSIQNLSQAIDMLTFRKELYNLQSINTESEVSNLLTLAQNAGYTGEAIKYLTELEQIYQEVASGTLTPIELGAKLAKASMLQQLIKKAADNVSYEPRLDLSGSEKLTANAANTGAAAGSACADAYVDAFEEELNSLEDLRNNGILSEKQYLDRLRVLYERYFKDKQQYAEQYAKYEHEYLNGYKSLYESVFSHAASLIGDRVSLLQDEKDAALDSLEAQKKAAEDSYKAQIRLLEDKKSAIQDEIDKIREANEDRKQAISLQEKERNLAKAENQRTVLQYSEERGFYYEADTEAIQEAREELEDAKADAQVRALEKQQDALDKQIDALQEMADASNEYWEAQKEQTEQYYSALITHMEEYKSRWEQLSGLQEKAEKNALLAELGYSEADLLNESSGALENLSLSYLGILKDLNTGNHAFIDSLAQLTGTDLSRLPGFLEQTRQSLDSLAGINTTALSDNLKGMGESFSDIASSASNAAAAISGNGTAQAEGGQAQTAGGTAGNPAAKTPSAAGRQTSLKAALEDLSTESVDNIHKISDAFAGEDSEGASVTGAIKKVTDMLGSTDFDNAAPDSLMAVLNEQTALALDEEKGIPAQTQAWEELNEPLGQAAKAVTMIKEALEDMDGKKFSIALGILNAGSTLVNDIISSYSQAGSNGQTPSNTTAADNSTKGKSTSHQKEPYTTHRDGGHSRQSISYTDTALNPAKTDYTQQYMPNRLNDSKKSSQETTLQPISFPHENDHSKFAEIYRKFTAAMADPVRKTDFITAAPKLNPVSQFTGLTSQSNYNNISNKNIYPTITGGLNITCPGITSSEVMKQVGIALQREFNGLSNRALQESMVRR